MAEVRFGWESVEDILAAPNLLEMLREHYEELAVDKENCPLDPDFERYRNLEKIGALRMFAGRQDGRLVAYMCYILGPHLHYRSTYFAVEDLFYLDPEYRHGGLGARMFAEAEKAVLKVAREAGWPLVRFMCHSKVHFRAERGGLDAFFERKGYQNSDKLWLKSVRT